MATEAEKTRFIAHYEKAVIEQATTTLRKYGSVPPIFSFAIQTQNGGLGIAPIGFSTDRFGEEEKNAFFGLAIPQAFAKFRADNITPLCFSSVYEAWLRIADNRDENSSKPEISQAELASLPKKEVLMVNFQTLTTTTAEIYEMLRPDGQAVNVDGELVEQVTLELLRSLTEEHPKEVSGRFMNVFRHYVL